MSGSLKFKLSERYNNRRQYERARCNTFARTARRKTKTNRLRKPIFIRYRKKIRDKLTRTSRITIDILAAVDSSAKTTELIQRW